MVGTLGTYYIWDGVSGQRESRPVRILGKNSLWTKNALRFPTLLIEAIAVWSTVFREGLDGIEGVPGDLTIQQIGFTSVHRGAS